jgi:capsular exopolysaccharide synthesis family protein
MGRIDEALRRSNRDASQGTGSEAPSPAPAPWGFDQQDDGDGAGTRTAPANGPAAEETPGRGVAGGNGRPARWGGFDPGATERLVVSDGASALLVEQFRTLAGTLHRTQLEKHFKSLIVTSASPGDGKSYVALNLALTLSASYKRRVLLIDADLRRPSLHALFQVRNSRGLSEALRAPSDEKLTTVQISDVLTLLPAGRPDDDPLGGLSSTRMKRIVEDATAEFDWVIVDSPPVGVLADAHLVAETVDAAILVVRAGVTRFEDLAAAADVLGQDHVLGIVLNAVEPEEIRGQGYYHHYYGRGSNRG